MDRSVAGVPAQRHRGGGRVSVGQYAETNRTARMATRVAAHPVPPRRRRELGPALLHVPRAEGRQVRFRVMTPDNRPIALTVEPALAAATALAVARHHPARWAAIAASDGRWLEVDLEGRMALTPASSDPAGWPALVAQALGQLTTLDATQRLPATDPTVRAVNDSR
jgi:hypothetical protein